ncbi:Trans-1,2-dihydrobenzene-1,2-diol dehydrogenase [Seminavis robusta]|uniref:D-xylose 1-dehydrogenase (NADP(+), D-xylono-1,5-lactone-forming) n=1 Tax=Seminavis robusta TaxID=568900 RepID=A0A9N8EA48_9STRA|nr:Trans-1,2-dihydrobenzene-1,2-diol dehydrogenase [Seminavis robusta]|eukprot:Sro869_g213500.1 Trans-1,2-dihydrobenzene-1,2-diol dehydrogenase (497) ;mRNA; f:29560-31050
MPSSTDVESNENHPLLRDGKKQHVNDENKKDRRIFTVFLIVLVFIGGLICISIGWKQHNSRSNNTESPWIYHTRGKSSQKDEYPWWETSNHVDTTYTKLQGSLPAPIISAKDSKRTNNLRWGIVGLGRIARDFTTALTMAGANITAVAAGSLPNATARARHFANLYNNIPHSYGSYQELAADPNVDIVYVATINSLHYSTAMMMLQAGKNVLLEKPMTMEYTQAQALVKAAEKANRLLVTNYWTRFFPVVKYVRSILASGRLGDISAMRGDFGFPTPPIANDRYLNRDSGGGAMLDVGCYLVNLALLVNPVLPQQIQASAQTTYMDHQYRIDTEMGFLLNWDSAKKTPSMMAVENNNKNETKTTPMIFSGQASFRRPSSFEFEINAQHGRLVIHNPANAATAATVYEYQTFGPLKHVEEIRSELPPFDVSFGPEQYPRGEGFVYIIREIEQCMFEKGIPGDAKPGCLELEELTLQDQLLTVNVTDTVLRSAGYWDW